MECPQCKRKFPDELITDIFIGGAVKNGGYVPTCPICALFIRNEFHDMPPHTPFDGHQANFNHEQAIEHCLRSNQSCADLRDPIGTVLWPDGTRTPTRQAP